ncbi:hypothetical protein [Francisella philomiragia]|uniref:hypothetical protein n=1 Tax=Francisella philomiragia TaxID=28110 RepID=UPI001907333B|nr:hypothetical protein [Francisella philomiragia]MBK2268296.1 hypothetical protein [Francisella philomiragia]MBK2279709.1 hypothetical protein [Francisella philomiragia]MBK2287607.1 hypothetical protein [Francisella philomiragia]MBK2289586.1 hypothetical protein [Francisella philomiragia]MBK2291484.1 hypothetical protein [Francisella philomiragia]
MENKNDNMNSGEDGCLAIFIFLFICIIIFIFLCIFTPLGFGILWAIVGLSMGGR